jgi:CBS domain-containing protein
MTSPAATVGPTSSFIEVVDVMLRRNVGGLPVVDPAGLLLGIVTVADLLAVEAPPARGPGQLGGLADALLGRDAGWLMCGPDRTVADVMTRQVVSVTPETSILEASDLMYVTNHRRLPVVRAGVVVGVLAVSDLPLSELRRPS